MAKSLKPKFTAGRNIAMKVPPHQYSQTVEFYRDVVGLPLVEELAPNVVFDFGGKRLWLDKVDQISHAEVWLEIHCEDVEVAARYLGSKGVVRRDEIEPLPRGFRGFWICNPASIIHLVSGD